MKPETPDTAASTPMQLILLSGISGSGKSIALKSLEDLGYYCIDNLPVGLIRAFIAQALDGSSTFSKVAIGVDARNRPAELAQLPQLLSDLATGQITTHLLFLDSSDEVLLKRYSETRRRHPLSAGGLSLAEAIARDRALMRPIATLSDAVIDSTDLNVHQLRRRVLTELGLVGAGISVLFESFAYKKGVPADADFVFDARALPNPHWDARLRPLSGRDQPVREWLQAQPDVSAFLTDVRQFLERWLPDSENTERSYVTVAVGCTGGRHRSVYIVESLSAYFRSKRETVQHFHRELG